MPRFIVKNGPKRQPQNRGCVSCIFGFFFQFLCHFPLVSPYFLLFHPILEPPNSPPNEVTGIYMAVYLLCKMRHNNITVLPCLLCICMHTSKRALLLAVSILGYWQHHLGKCGTAPRWGAKDTLWQPKRTMLVTFLEDRNLLK